MTGTGNGTASGNQEETQAEVVHENDSGSTIELATINNKITQERCSHSKSMSVQGR